MADRPNIVFLLNDHQAYYRHGWDGGPGVQRPNFRRLAAEGVEFARAYTACPLCGPARRTMLTGLFPHSHREIKNDSNHPYDREVYLDILAENGYESSYCGKWHAGPGTALDHGCDGFSYPSYNNPYTKQEYAAYREAMGLPVPEILIERSFGPPVMKNGRPNPLREGERYVQGGGWCNEHASGIMLTPVEGHEAFFLAHLACDRLRAIASDGNASPFALRVDFWGPHQPYFPTRPYAELYDPGAIPEYPNFSDELERKPEIYRSETNYPLSDAGKLRQPNPLPWSEWQKVLARSYAQTTLVDAAGGRTLDTLDELGLSENTLVIWTTDHGDAVGCHGGHFDKRSYMPEEMVRVPLAMRFPGRIPPGQVRNELVSNIDLAPTILETAHAAFSRSVDGRSLIPLATGETLAWRDDLMCETHGHGEDHVGRLIVTDRYKYVANRGDMNELYDLWNDPYEMSNMIDESNQEDLVVEMQNRLDAWRQATGDRESIS